MSIITNDIKELAREVISKKPNGNYSLEDAKKTIKEELQKYTSSKALFEKNKYDVYALIGEEVDEFLPNKVISVLGRFATIKQVPQGQKAVFFKKLGKGRAKSFITQVGLAGVYESFRLDSTSYEVAAKAVGGAARIDWERFLDGQENLDDYFEIILEGLEDAIYIEVQKALAAAVDSMPDANKYTESSFDADKMKKAINTVRAYGQGAVIFCSPEFASTMDPTLLTANSNPNVSVNDIEDIRTKGYIGMFGGAPVVVLPQSFVDETNTKKVFDTQVAYIFPTGGESVVNIVFEGNTQVDDYKNRDRSMEIEAYRKFGVAIHTYNNWAMYRNTGIAQEADLSYGYPNL